MQKGGVTLVVTIAVAVIVAVILVFHFLGRMQTDQIYESTIVFEHQWSGDCSFIKQKYESWVQQNSVLIVEESISENSDGCVIKIKYREKP